MTDTDKREATPAEIKASMLIADYVAASIFAAGDELTPEEKASIQGTTGLIAKAVIIGLCEVVANAAAQAAQMYLKENAVADPVEKIFRSAWDQAFRMTARSAVDALQNCWHDQQAFERALTQFRESLAEPTTNHNHMH